MIGHTLLYKRSKRQNFVYGLRHGAPSLLRPFRLFMIKSGSRMGLNDKSRKRNAASWRERIQDGEMSSRSQTERKKGPFPVHPIPGCRRKILIRPSFPALPAEREIPATVLPGMTRRPSDEPPARLRRKSTKTIRKEKKKNVPHAQEPCAGRVSRFSEPCCLSC